MPAQQQGKNPLGTAWSTIDQNVLGGYAPGGAPPAHRQIVNSFQQGRDISRENNGGGLRQAGRGAVNVLDAYLMGGMLPGGVTPREVFTGQPKPKPAEGETQSKPQGNGFYQGLDNVLFGGILPGGAQRPQQQGKNPQGQVPVTDSGRMPGPIPVQNPTVPGIELPGRLPPPNTGGTSSTPSKNPQQSPPNNAFAQAPNLARDTFNQYQPQLIGGQAQTDALNRAMTFIRSNGLGPNNPNWIN